MYKRNKFCECGCGQRAKTGFRFIWGHNGRGIPRTKEVRERISKVLKGEIEKVIPEKQKCRCGCNEYAESGRLFIKGHFYRGRKRSYDNIVKWYFSRWAKWPMSELRECKCGCGEYLKTKDSKRFVVGHALKGTKKTEEHKRKIGLGNKGKFVSQESCLKMSLAKKGRKQKPDTEEGKRNKSLARKKYIKENPDCVTGNNYGKGGYFFSKKNNKDIHYRSSYELLAYELLEQMSKVKYYDTEPFAIQYQYEGIDRRTIPDILITYTDETKELIEVKPEYMMDNLQTKAKLQAMASFAKDNDWKFDVWTERTLH